MALLTHAVGAAPVDVGAALNLDGNRVFENLGARPLRFVVAAAAGEMAPLDVRAGHLLLPGRRETVATAAGAPVWVWSEHPTRLGVGPAWQVAAGLGGAGGLSLVYGAKSVETTLDGAHLAGATVLRVDDATGLAAGRIHVTGEVHTATAVDESANTVTIEAPGLAAAQADGRIVGQAPLVGADDTLTLPGGPYAELDIRLLYDLRHLTSGVESYSGRNAGAFYSAGMTRSSWVETLTGSNYWWAFTNIDTGSTYSVGLVHATSSLTFNSWSIELDPATSRLSFLPTDPGMTVSRLPRVYSLIVAGRGA